MRPRRADLGIAVPTGARVGSRGGALEADLRGGIALRQGENSCHSRRSFTCANTTAGGAAISALRATCSSLGCSAATAQKPISRATRMPEPDPDRPSRTGVFSWRVGDSGKRDSRSSHDGQQGSLRRAARAHARGDGGSRRARRPAGAGHAGQPRAATCTSTRSAGRRSTADPRRCAATRSSGSRR